MPDERPLLSACIIARDEERHLERALRSVQPVADEIVVTDTGSTDGTVEVARRHGASVFDFAWIDDFSAAYNFCSEKARGEWILQLDADEELLECSLEETRRAIRDQQVLAYAVERRDLVDSDNLDLYSSMLHVRLFRNHRALRFVGRIHHRFVEPLPRIAAREGLRLERSTIQLRHYGYAGGQKQQKLARAARLMELELVERPGQFYYLVELGRTYLAMEDSRGTALLTQAAQMVHDSHPEALAGEGMLAMLLEHILASDSLPEGFPLSWAAAADLAQRRFPDSVPLLWQLALRDFKQQQFENCARRLERVLRLGTTHGYDMRASFDPQIMGGRALLNLGVCYVRLARLRDARKCFRQLTLDPQFSDQARANLAAIRRL